MCISINIIRCNKYYLVFIQILFQRNIAFSDNFRGILNALKPADPDFMAGIPAPGQPGRNVGPAQYEAVGFAR